MDMKRCENGHFYDADKFEACPYCQQKIEDASPTVGRPTRGPEEAVTVPGKDMDIMALMHQGKKDTLATTVSGATVDGSDDDSKTIYYGETLGGKAGIEPVTGWLVCVKGDAYGKSFNLKTGRNFIGRSSSMDVVLSGDNSVSRERHAVVIYEPRKREFLAQPGDSRSLFYLNDDVVLMTEKLKKGDILTLGNTKLMFIPCCGPDFSWEYLEDSNEKKGM